MTCAGRSRRRSLALPVSARTCRTSPGGNVLAITPRLMWSLTRMPAGRLAGTRGLVVFRPRASASMAQLCPYVNRIVTKPDGTIDTVQVNWATGQKVFDGSVDFKNSGVSVNLSNMDVTDGSVSVGFNVAGGASMSFQVGASASDTIAVNIANVDT